MGVRSSVWSEVLTILLLQLHMCGCVCVCIYIYICVCVCILSSFFLSFFLPFYTYVPMNTRTHTHTPYLQYDTQDCLKTTLMKITVDITTNSCISDGFYIVLVLSLIMH